MLKIAANQGLKRALGARNKHYMSSQEDVTNEIEAAENMRDVSVFDNEMVNKTEVSKVAFS